MELKEVVLELGKKLDESDEVVKNRLKYFEGFTRAEMPSFKRGLGMQIDTSRIELDNIFVDLENLHRNQRFLVSSGQNLKPKIKVLCGRPKINFENNFSDCLNKFEFLHNSLQINVNIVVKKKDDVKLELEPTQFCSINIVCEEGAKLVVFEKDSLKNNYNSVILNVNVKKGSFIDYIIFQNNSKKSVLYSKRTADLEEDAKINWYCIDFGANTNISQVISNLEGKNASAENNNILFLSKEQQADLFTNTEHNAKNTNSGILIKAALLDSSKAVLRGLIKMNKDAPFSVGRQKQDCILLSSDAKVNTIPELEIKNSEVSCSHSAGVSEVDEEKMFYLESRGINRNKALSQILAGFFEPILSKIELLNVRAEVIKMIEEELSKGTEVRAYA